MKEEVEEIKDEGQTKAVTAFDLLNRGYTIPMPWDVHRVLGGTAREIEVLGDLVYIGGDSVSLKEMRLALTWLVFQFNGEVTWNMEKK